MVTSTAESINLLLACSACDEQRKIILNQAMFDELGREGQIRIFCSVCGTGTLWNGVQTDRRSGFDRRSVPHARLELPIYVRCEHPPQQFAEVNTTLTASCKGASFFTRHALRQGMTISVVLPFKEGDPNPIESTARVAWLKQKGDGWEVGVEFRR